MQQAELAADQPLLNFFSSPCFSVTLVYKNGPGGLFILQMFPSSFLTCPQKNRLVEKAIGLEGFG
jgi:hypothetical protein